jgi:allophanate hydrolase
MMDLGVSRLLLAYQSGELSPRQVLEDVYANIERIGQRPVWISLRSFEASLQALERAENAGERGPLFGVPFAVKDNIDVAGLPTTAACPDFAYLPSRSAAVVELLEKAGAIVIGKTNMDQFATGLVGTRSPYGVCASVFDSNYISGGSSSGSAVAVARGDVSFALGTDTAGSGRVPAAFNGIIGVKPTCGLVSTRGIVPACRSLDCVSIFARDLADAARVFEISARYDARDPFCRRRSGGSNFSAETPRFGVPQWDQLQFFGDTDSEALYREFIVQLENAGWCKVHFDYAPFERAARLLYEGPWIAERLAALDDFITKNPGAVHPVVRGLITGANSYSASDAFRALYDLMELRRAVEPLWQACDAIVLPTAPTHYRITEVLAEPIELNKRLGTYTNFANLLDLCALSVPAGSKPSGLPFGVTWFGPAEHDRELLQLAARAAGKRTVPVNREAAGRVLLAVAGAHLSGQPLNGQLLSRRARLVMTTTTSPQYRLFALNTTPAKPGLVYAPDTRGRAIEVEVWELENAAFGSFVSELPAPMTIGVTRLSDGSLVKGFCCEPYAIEGARDITEYGGWRAYLAAG